VGELAWQLRRVELHRSGSLLVQRLFTVGEVPGGDARQAEHQLARQVLEHFPVQQGFLFAGADQVVFVVDVDPLGRQGFWPDQGAALAIADLEHQFAGQLVLGRGRAVGIGDRPAFPGLIQQLELVGRRTAHIHPVDLQRFEHALVGGAVAVARGDIQFIQLDAVDPGAAQVETAGAEQQGGAEQGAAQQMTWTLQWHADFSVAYQLATILTSLPGTTITLRMLRPSVKRSTFSFTRAAASTASRLASAGTWRWPRSLPLTWITRSRLSWTRALSSSAGQGASITGVSWPSACQRAWAMCGVMGASSKVTVSSPSWSTARSSSSPWAAFSSTFIRVMTAAMAVLNLWCWLISWLAMMIVRYLAWRKF